MSGLSGSFQLSLNSQCYLCDLFFTQSNEPFILYKCFCCMKFTPYCFSCELKIQRLFGIGNLFKCVYCNRLTNAIEKIEIENQNIQNNKNSNFNSNSFSTRNASSFKTPIKSLIESNSLINNIKLNKINNPSSYNEEERKDNNNSIIPTDNNSISNFINEFKEISLFDLANNSNMTKMRNQPINKKNSMNNSLTIKDNNNINNNGVSNFVNRNRTLTNSNSMNDFRKINDYSLLKDRKRIKRKFFINNEFLGKKRDESDNNYELRGFNKSKDRNCSNNNRNAKVKTLISKQMSKLYSNNNDDSSLTRGNFGLYSAVNNSRTEFDLKNNLMRFNGIFGNSSGINFNNISNNMYSNKNGFVSFAMNNTISGTETPHKFNINNDEQYF